MGPAISGNRLPLVKNNRSNIQSSLGTAVAYEQGGYEITVSNAGPESEFVLMNAIRKLLRIKEN